MNILQIDGYNSLIKNIEGQKKAWLLLYKNDNESSKCALANLSAACVDINDLVVLSADVAEVRDIHNQYDIKSVPTLILFEDGDLKNIIKGCHPAEYYRNLLEESVFFNSGSENDKPAKRVIVYSTPTCSWCATLKNHLRHHHIKYTDIDVSKDQSAAQAMIAKSGQQGVPQMEINGEIIVGFDKNRINKLLEIQG